MVQDLLHLRGILLGVYALELLLWINDAQVSHCGSFFVLANVVVIIRTHLTSHKASAPYIAFLYLYMVV